MSDLELGIALPNTVADASLASVTELARVAIDAGFDSLWLTDHLLVGPDAAEAYGTVVEPLTGLFFASLGDVGLGTSILLLPLRHPAAVAKQAVRLQED